MQKNETKGVVVLCGSIIAFHIGSGFASGQEIIQFFSSFGLVKSLAGLAVAFFLFTATALFIFARCKAVEGAQAKDCYTVLCTKYVGMLFKKATPIVLFFIYIVMLSGTGAALHEFFGVPTFVGRIILAVCVLATVVKGLNGVVDIIGRLGTVIIVLVVLLGILGIFNNPQGLLVDYSMHESTKIADSFLASAILYSGFSVVTGVVFLSGLSLKIKDKKQAFLVALLGNGGFFVAALFMNLGILANYLQVNSYQIPALWLTMLISKSLAWVFVLMLFSGAYTTAVPMLWSITAALEKQEKSRWYTLFCMMLTLIAICMGNLPFDLLLNIIYPTIGGLGLVLFLDMIIKWVMEKRLKC